MPTRFTGHTSWASTFHVKSPPTNKSNGPYPRSITTLLALSEVSASLDFDPEQRAFGFDSLAPAANLCFAARHRIANCGRFADCLSGSVSPARITARRSDLNSRYG